MIAVALAAALLVATLPAAPPRPRSAPAVLVTGGDRFGAGVVWDAPAGLVLTALHVVEGAAEVRVSLGGARSEPARVVDVDPALDLALLSTAPLGEREPPLAAPVAGVRVRLLGFPRRSAAEVDGVVLDAARRFAGARYVEIAGGAEPGCSGGPVVDASGAVVGIVDLVVAQDGGRTLAVPIDAAEARFPRRAPAGGAGAETPIAAAAVRRAPPARARQD